MQKQDENKPPVMKMWELARLPEKINHIINHVAVLDFFKYTVTT